MDNINVVYLAHMHIDATCISILVYTQIVLKKQTEMASKIHVNKNGSK